MVFLILHTTFVPQPLFLERSVRSIPPTRDLSSSCSLARRPTPSSTMEGSSCESQGGRSRASRLAALMGKRSIFSTRPAEPSSSAPPGPSEPAPQPVVRTRSRTRSPERPALPALRRDAPGRRSVVGLASLPVWASGEDRQEALLELQQDVHAASTRAGVAARMGTIEKALAGWGLKMWPPTVDSLLALSASLKRGKYRSAYNYLYSYKAEAQRQGHQWPQQLDRLLKDCIRSCERGLGAPTKAAPLPLEKLKYLPGAHAAWFPGGPLGPRNLVVAGSYWMLREIEASTVRAALVTVEGGDGIGEPVVKLLLPASKNDPMAVGCSRAHRCSCTDRFRADCPAHAVIDQLYMLQRTFPEKHEHGKPLLDLPLFPTAAGAAAEKQQVVATIQRAAGLLGVQDAPDGSERITGHSLRPTGAQGLVRRGWSVWAVQLMGRWGSEVVKGYLRLAPLDAPLAAPGRQTTTRDGRSLEDLLISNSQSASGSAAAVPCSTTPQQRVASEWSAATGASSMEAREAVEEATVPPVAIDDRVWVVNTTFYYRSDGRCGGVHHVKANDAITVCG